MKKLQYIGPQHGGLFLPAGQGGEVHVARMGAGVEVEDKLAAELLARFEYDDDGKPQKTWRLAPRERATPKSTKAPAKKAAPAAPTAPLSAGDATAEKES
jgi:hypothetical protein